MMVFECWEWLRIFGDDSLPPIPRTPLCDDVLIDILLRVPPDVLARFKCASRQSYLLINDPEFLHRYRSQLPDLPSPLAGLFYQYQQPETHSFLSKPLAGLFFQHHHDQQRNQVGFANVKLDGNKRGFQCIDKSLSFLPNPAVRIIASREGLLLCSSTKLDLARYYVCNPITKQCALLPQSKRPYDSCSTGFFVDRKYGHYQVIRIPYLAAKNTFAFVETFSSKTGRWRLLRLEFSSHYCLFSPDYPPVQLNGSLHWVDGFGSILAYNITQEKFSFLELPFKNGVLGVSGSLLYYAFSDGYSLQVRVRVGQSWVPLCRVSLGSLVRNNSEVLRRLGNLKLENLLFKPVYLDESDPDPRVVFLKVPGWIVSYDFHQRKIEAIQLHSEEQNIEVVFPYVMPQVPFPVEFHGLN